VRKSARGDNSLTGALLASHRRPGCEPAMAPTPPWPPSVASYAQRCVAERLSSAGRPSAGPAIRTPAIRRAPRNVACADHGPPRQASACRQPILPGRAEPPGPRRTRRANRPDLPAAAAAGKSLYIGQRGTVASRVQWPAGYSDQPGGHCRQRRVVVSWLNAPLAFSTELPIIIQRACDTRRNNRRAVLKHGTIRRASERLAM